MGPDIVFKSAKSTLDQVNLLPNTYNVLEKLIAAGGQVHLALSDAALDVERRIVQGHKVFFDNGIPRLSPQPVPLPMADVYGMINRSPLKVPLQETYPGMIIVNNEMVRGLSKKNRQAELFPDLCFPTAVIDPESGELSEQALELIARSAKVVVKPNSSYGSNNVTLLEPDPVKVLEKVKEIAEARIGKKDQMLLVQPYMPAERIEGLMVLDPKDAEVLASADNAIELRVFCSLNANTMNKPDPSNYVHGIGRRISVFEDEPVDKWIALRQETIPTELFTTAAMVARSIMLATESKGLHTAIDFLYHGGRFYVVELNVRDPQYPNSMENTWTSETVSNQVAGIFKA